MYLVHQESTVKGSNCMKKIRNKLIIVFISIALICITILSSAYYYNGTQIIEEEVTTSIDDSVKQLNNSIAQFLTKFEDAIHMFSFVNSVRQVVEDPNTYYEDTMQLFKSYYEANPEVAFAYFGPEKILLENKKLVTWPDSTEALAKDKEWLATNRDWYKDAMSSQDKIIWSQPYFDSTTNLPMITLSKTVDDSSGSPSGVMAIDLYLEDISKQIDNYKTIEKSKIWVLNKGTGGNYTILASTNLDEGNTQVDDQQLIDKLSQSEKGSFYYKNDYLAYTTNPMTNWKIVEFVDKSIITSSLNRIISSLGIVSVVVIGIALIMSIIVSSRISKPIVEVSKLMSKVEKGDFDVQVKIKGKDEISLLAQSFDSMINNIKHLIKDSQSAVEKLTISTDFIHNTTKEAVVANSEITIAVNEVSSGATTQASNTNHLVEEIDSFSTKIEHASERSKHIETQSLNTKELGEQGNVTMKNLYTKNEEITHSFHTIMNMISTLQDKSKDIGNIVGVIDEIADKTRLLSLNASIEAARAGEHGKGFAVVANEVKKLSDQSIGSTSEISSIINDIQNEIEKTFEAVKVTDMIVQNNKSNMKETQEIFDSIVKRIDEITDEIKSISIAFIDMINQKDSLVKEIESIANISEQTAASSEEISATIEEQNNVNNKVYEAITDLQSLAKELNQSISVFKIKQ